MTRQEHLRLHAMEEAIELAHRLSKALRFGMGQTQPGQPFTNEARVLHEFTDLIAVMELVGVPLSMVADEEIKAKHAKVEKYLQLAHEQGTLTE